MNIQLTNRIKQNARSFSKGQRLIAKYIEEHYDKVAFMTASKLGATVGVSESTWCALRRRSDTPAIRRFSRRCRR